MPADKTIDTVVLILVIGLIGLGLLSMFIGWLGRVRDRVVNRSEPVMESSAHPIEQTERTDETDGPSVSALLSVVDRMKLDRTKAPLIELMVYNGWTTAEVRAVLKGENAAIGTEVDATRKRLGIVPPDRQLRVKDERGERMIPLASR